MPKAAAPKFDPAAFDARLVSLGIYSAELAQIIGCDASLIDRWREGRGAPDADARVLLRVLSDDHRAALAVQRVRDGFTRDMRGDAAKLAGIEAVPPDGSGHHGTTGGRPE
jgi:hypothetical protein